MHIELFDYTDKDDIESFIEYACNSGYRDEILQAVKKWENDTTYNPDGVEA
jgi:hypothetical protein